MTNEKWTQQFLALALFISAWSKDPSTRVGAVIADARRRVVGLGYNGFPRGVDDADDRLRDRATKLAFTMHAEPNAILNATGSVYGCSMFVSTMPCQECAKHIVQAGIAELVCPEPTAELVERWGPSFEIASTILREGGCVLVTRKRML